MEVHSLYEACQVATYFAEQRAPACGQPDCIHCVETSIERKTNLIHTGMGTECEITVTRHCKLEGPSECVDITYPW